MGSLEERAWLARVLDAGGTAVGAAFAVDRNHVLTCAHVVKAAGAGGPGDTVSVDFPRLGGAKCDAEVLVEGWAPEAGTAGDVALLELKDPPEGLCPVALRSLRSLDRLAFSAHGLPEGLPDGVWTRGSLGMGVGEEWVQLEPASVRKVDPGFSGTAVWSDVHKAVVGMMVARDRDTEGGVAFAIPARVLAKHSAVVREALATTDRSVLRLDYPYLEDYIDWASRRRVRFGEEGFVGRGWVFERLCAFAEQHGGGYFRIIAAAGLGKTALAAAIARHYEAPAFFVDAAAGRSRPDQCLNHLCAELIDHFELPRDHFRARAGEDSGFLSELLEEVADHQHPVWLVIDGLDEAERLTAYANPMLLPRAPPPHVVFVLTHRPGAYAVEVAPGVAQEELEIQDGRPQRKDVTAYLSWEATHNDAVRAARETANPPVSVEAFVERLTEDSERNFMYLRYMVDDIAKRDPPSLDLDQLPQGLEGYYSRMWTVMEQEADRDWQTWDYLHRPVIERLAVAGEAVAASWLADQTQHREYEVDRRVLRHWERFLRPGGTTPRKWQVLHESFRDFLAKTLDLRAAHQGIADYYLADQRRWNMHDGYPRRHLASHLRLAGDYKRLIELVDRPTWRDAQLGHDASAAAYLHDVAQAWAAAVDVDTNAIQEGRRPPLLLAEVTSALTTSELHSGTLPKGLLVRVLKAHSLTPGQALAIAVRTPDAGDRAKALAALAPYLPDELQTRALTEALAAAVSTDEPHIRAQALSALAPQLPDTLVPRALTAAESIDEPYCRSWAITDLVPRLSGERRTRGLTEALSAAETIGYPSARANRVVALTPYLRSDVRRRALADALAAASAATDDQARAQALIALAPKLPGALLQEALNAAYATADPFRFAEAVAVLAAHLPDEQRTRSLADALRIASTTLDPGARARSLAVLVPHLPYDLRTPALTNALAAAAMSLDSTDRAEALVALAPHLPDALLEEALIAGSRTTWLDARANVLAALVPRLRGELRARALTMVSDDALAAIDGHPNALAALARHLPDALLADAIAATVTLDPDARGKVLAILTPRLPDALLANAVAASTTSDSGARGVVLALLAPYLPGEQRAPALTEALTAAEASRDPYARSRTLAALAPQLDAVQLDEALSAATDTADAYARAHALAALAPHLPVKRRAHALTEALSATNAIGPHVPGTHHPRADVLAALAGELPDELMTDALRAALASWSSDRARGLAALAPRLSDELLADALAATQAVADCHDRAEAVAALAPYLVGEQRARALTDAFAAAATTPNSYHRAAALAALAPHLPNDLLADAVAAAIAASDPHDRATALSALIPRLAGEQRTRALNEALIAANATSDSARATALAARAPLVSDEQRTRALADALAAAAAITDTSPVEALLMLAPHLPDELLAEALAVATGTTGYHRAAALGALAPYLPRELLSDALAAAAAITDESPRAAALAALAPHLPDQLLTNALAIATAIEDSGARAEALAGIAPHISRATPATLHRVWDEALRGAAQKGQTEFARMCDQLVPLFRTLIDAANSELRA